MSVLIFWATQVMPGDVAHMIVGQFATDEQIRAVRAKLRSTIRSTSVPALGGALLQGDLGLSLMMDRPIGPLIARRSCARPSLAASPSCWLLSSASGWRVHRGAQGQQGRPRGVGGHVLLHLGAGSSSGPSW
jgi:ABC-type dipeptide/oligopeptide/nickel transport system permease component